MTILCIRYIFSRRLNILERLSLNYMIEATRCIKSSGIFQHLFLWNTGIPHAPQAQEAWQTVQQEKEDPSILSSERPENKTEKKEKLNLTSIIFDLYHFNILC